MKRTALAVLVVALVVPTIALGATVVVSVFEYGYDPDPVLINTGDTVQWNNDGTIAHTSTSDTNIWNSGLIPPGGSYSRTFNAMGNFPYHCAIHPTLMSGEVVVSEPTPVEPGTWGKIKALWR